jgi:uncharacterized tellurite resistance protein B-like protein
MFGVIRNIIEGKKNKKGQESQEDKELKKHVAAGVLLLEAAHIDNECSKEEMDHIIDTLKDKFALSDSCVDDLLDLANADREQSVDLWEFSRHINNHFTTDEKQAVMEDVWRIILLDGKLDKHEDYYAHKLANLLHLSHKEMISAKLKARNQVANLK